MKQVLTGIFLTILSSHAISAEVEDATVTKVGSYGDGRIFVALDKTIPEIGCENDRFDVEGTHEERNTIISIALAALMSDKKINVKTSGCLGSLPKFVGSAESFFYIKK